MESFSSLTEGRRRAVVALDSIPPAFRRRLLGRLVGIVGVAPTVRLLTSPSTSIGGLLLAIPCDSLLGISSEEGYYGRDQRSLPHDGQRYFRCLSTYRVARQLPQVTLIV